MNWTPATPTLSEAVAESVAAEPETVAPDTGAVSETVGGVVSPEGESGPGQVSLRICTAAKYQKSPLSTAPVWPLLPMPKLVRLWPPAWVATPGSTQKVNPPA